MKPHGYIGLFNVPKSRHREYKFPNIALSVTIIMPWHPYLVVNQDINPKLCPYVVKKYGNYIL